MVRSGTERKKEVYHRGAEDTEKRSNWFKAESYGFISVE